MIGAKTVDGYVCYIESRKYLYSIVFKRSCLSLTEIIKARIYFYMISDSQDENHQTKVKISLPSSLFLISDNPVTLLLSPYC